MDSEGSQIIWVGYVHIYATSMVPSIALKSSAPRSPSLLRGASLKEREASMNLIKTTTHAYEIFLLLTAEVADGDIRRDFSRLEHALLAKLGAN